MRHYRESLIDTKKLANKVLAEIETRGIKPNPINFMVWYEYLLERDPFVVDRISQAQDHEHEDVAKELFNHIVSRICVMSEIDHIVLKLVNELIDDIDSWENNLEAHSKVLETALDVLSEKCTKQNNASSAALVLQGVIGSIKELTFNAEDIKHKMEDVRSEVDTLKKQLEMSYIEAHTDPLTGIGNRRAMDKFLVEHLDVSIHGEKFSCVILDVDFFKKINDQHGHLVGDSVLRYIAKQLKQLTKGQDFVARFGGEEFIILLPLTDAMGAYQFAEKVRKSLQDTKLKIRNTNQELTITASLGVATFHDGEQIADFLARADRALYVAKETGRNRVVDEVGLAAQVL